MTEDRGFFPFSVLVGTMAMEAAELESDWEPKQGLDAAKTKKHLTLLLRRESRGSTVREIERKEGKEEKVRRPAGGGDLRR